MIPTDLTTSLSAVGVLWRTGLIPRDPRHGVTGARALRRLGPLGGLPELCAARFGDRVAIIDDQRSLTFNEFATRTAQFGRVFASLRPGGQPGIGILCRNHADALVALCAANAIGARVVLLNSDFAQAQVDAVAARERLDAIVYDDEFATALAGFTGVTWCAWSSEEEPSNSLNMLAARESGAALPAAPQDSTLITLTSGTSGTPKGAPRARPNPLLVPAGFLERIPVRGNERILVSAPVFHGWGMIVATVGLMVGATLVLQRRFDAERAVADLERHRCAAFIAVPTMLRRIVALGDRVAQADLGALRIIASGGARLEGTLVRELQSAFGPVLHNLYGSTEASYISIATPEDLAAEPDCAGKPALGISVRIADSVGELLPAGANGRILVRTTGQIAAYTDGTSKAVLDGHLDTGDRGHLDVAGRLHVTGRSDGMVVSGGENVFPEEVELALQQHPLIADAVVVAVADVDFGQRLRAYLVRAGNGDSATRFDSDAVREHLSGQLPRSRMPRDIIFVGELPRGASGKVLRRTLDELEKSHP